MKTLFAVLLLSVAAFAQGGAYVGSPVINGVGQPIANAQVAITVGNPCGTSPTYANCNGQPQGIYSGPIPPATLASVFTDITLGTTAANPIPTDPLGNWTVYATPGVYWAVVYGYQIVPQVQIIIVSNGSGGGGGGVNCATALHGSLAAFLTTLSLGCDQNFLTDFAGNFSAQSGQFLGGVNGFTTYIGGGAAPGTQVKYKLPANAFRFQAPLTVGTSYYFVPPATRCSVGQTWILQAETTDGNGDKVDTYQCGNVGAGGMETQTNGVDNANCTGGPPCAAPLLNLVAGTNVTLNNTSGGNVQINASVGAGPQIGTPTAPTVTPKGTPGSTSYSYLVFGCQDGGTCSATTLHSSVGSTSTGNASLSTSNFNLLTGYGDTLYGPTGYSVCRTVGGATQGLIAVNAGKQFADTGLVASGACPASANTTALTALGLVTPNIGCNALPDDIGHGVDHQPCTPNAFDEEFGNTFGVLGDVNNPPWILPFTLDAGTTTTLTGGMLSISTTAGAGADHWQCLVKPVPVSTPWTFEDMHFIQTNHTSNGWGGIAVYDSVSGRLAALSCTVTSGNNFNIVFSHVTAIGTWSNPMLGGTDSCLPIGNFKIRDDGTNIIASQSNDGIKFVQERTETIASFLVNPPTHVGMCALISNTGATAVDFGYLRRTE